MKREEREGYDLGARTIRFGESIIRFCRTVRPNVITSPLISQLVRSATSVGANYAEADESISKKDFRLKISIAKKEAKETEFWLQMMASAEPEQIDEIRRLWKEAHELLLIFVTIYRKVNRQRANNPSTSSDVPA